MQAHGLSAHTLDLQQWSVLERLFNSALSWKSASTLSFLSVKSLGSVRAKPLSFMRALFWFCGSSVNGSDLTVTRGEPWSYSLISLTHTQVTTSLERFELLLRPTVESFFKERFDAWKAQTSKTHYSIWILMQPNGPTEDFVTQIWFALLTWRSDMGPHTLCVYTPNSSGFTSLYCACILAKVKALSFDTVEWAGQPQVCLLSVWVSVFEACIKQ